MSPPTKRSSLPIILATAAVTVAVGVTAATLSGYVGPKTVASPEPAATSVVLVPVTSTSQPQPQPDPEPMFASFRSHEQHERHEHGSSHHEDER